MRSLAAGWSIAGQQASATAPAVAPAAVPTVLLHARLPRHCNVLQHSSTVSNVALVASQVPSTAWQQRTCNRMQQALPRRRQHSNLQKRWSNTTAAAGDSSDQALLAAEDSSAEQIQQQQDGSKNCSSSSSSSSSSHQPRQQKAVPIRIAATTDQQTYSLEDTKALVETAMLSAVSGLAFLLSTLLKLDNSLGYFLPLPIAIAACRSGVAAAWWTMMATAFLLLVLLGPLRAITYVLMHGMLAAALGSMWVWQWPWGVSIISGAVLRMAGQLGYLVLSSLTMNENLFAVMLANVHNLLDRLSAALGSSGSASTLTISCMIFALLLVNGICYVFLLHVVYNVILGSMGFKLGPLPGIVRKYLYAGVPQQQQQQPGKA